MGTWQNTDYGLDQITDIDLLGSEYIFIKGNALDEIEKVILIADEDGTPIFKDGVNTGIVLDAGEHIIYQGGDYTNGNMYISTYDPTTTPTTVPKKLVAYQGIGYAKGLIQVQIKVLFLYRHCPVHQEEILITFLL